MKHWPTGWLIDAGMSSGTQMMIAWLPWLVTSHEVRSISTCELQTDLATIFASQESTFQLIPTCALPTELTQKDEGNDLI